MEAVLRKPFQGVTNIIRFNWHFYVFAGVVILLSLASLIFIPAALSWMVYVVALITFLTTFISLAVSCYVYDYSGLYKLQWLQLLAIEKNAKLVNINAGFDETSAILLSHYPTADLCVFDFYDPEKHTEVSIARARKAYGAYPGTIAINTSSIPLEKNSVDVVFNIFAVHEIRETKEREHFLRTQHDVLKPGGVCVVVEHLRDVSNFMAYNIGFLHFFSSATWKGNFAAANFTITQTKKITPFVTVFILKRNNGNTP